MIYRGSGLNQASFDCPCSKTKLHLDYACGPRPISTTVEKCSSVPSLLARHLHVCAVRGYVSRLRLHSYICATAPREALACTVPKWDAVWVAPPRRHADFSPRSCRLWKPLLTHFLVQCFVAQFAGCFSALANMFGQTVFGPCRHLLVKIALELQNRVSWPERSH